MSSTPSSTATTTTSATTVCDMKLLIFVLKTLGPGKAASQACHAVCNLSNAMMTEYYETFPITKRCLEYRAWSLHPTKIVLACTPEQLMAIASEHDDAFVVIDEEGDKYVQPGTLVAIALPPRTSEQCKSIGNGFKLL